MTVFASADWLPVLLIVALIAVPFALICWACRDRPLTECDLYCAAVDDELDHPARLVLVRSAVDMVGRGADVADFEWSKQAASRRTA